MLTPDQLAYALGLVVVSAPALLVALVGLTSLFGRPLSEWAVSTITQLTIVLGLTASAGVWALMLVTGDRNVPVELGHWVEIEGFHFDVKLVFDRLTIPFVLLSFLLCGIVGAFASRYLHREPGFNRFFFLYSLFVLGMTLAGLAGTIETLFAGWELVGISSALLVAFFQHRPSPVRNGLRVWAVYRFSDAALLLAAVALHHLHGEGNFDELMGGGDAWPYGVAHLSPTQALVVGSLLIIAAAGKSALVPFSGWLPRAMEGPTPSSAVFYGALSVHLGAFLLLRVVPILALSLPLSLAVLFLGLATAAVASLAARVQTDIKSALSFASLTQVGLIVAEIGLAAQVGRWLCYVALAHLVGHACLRTLQFVRASSILEDYRRLENAIGERLPEPAAGPRDARLDGCVQWLYTFALERGGLDTLLADYVARPVLAVFRGCDAAERRWTDFLTGGASREADPGRTPPSTLEDPL